MDYEFNSASGDPNLYEVTLQRRTVGFIRDGAVFRDRNDRLIGYIQDTMVFIGGTSSGGSHYGGRLVGYVEGTNLFEGGSTGGGRPYGGRRVRDMNGAHPVWQAAAFLLLT